VWAGKEGRVEEMCWGHMETRKIHLDNRNHMIIDNRGLVWLSPPGHCVGKEATVNYTTFVFEFDGTDIIKHMVKGIYEGHRMMDQMIAEGKKVMLQADGICLRSNLS
jgi:hypothetical protein